MANHISQCDHCGLIVDECSKRDESALAAELRGLRGDSLADAGETASAAFAIPDQLVRLACEAAAGNLEPVSLDAGRRLAKQLSDGGCRLGRFELVVELGSGAFGHVFKAYDPDLDRWVAIKVQRTGALATNEEVDRFLREAQNIGRLNHPGIVSVYDTGRSDDDIYYLVTEFVDGDSLAAKLPGASYSFSESAALVASMADALQYAHERGIVHRDIKPSNVVIDHVGRPHIMDFGLAKNNDDESANALTSAGTVLGTPAYMSPEQAVGDSRSIDARSDIYSLGVLLYEMLTGERPFQGNRRMLLLQVVEDEPRPLRQLNPTVPIDLQTICLKALQKSPAKRYHSAREMAEDLRRFCHGEPINARPLGIGEKLWRWCRRYPLAASLLLSVPLVAVGGFTYLSVLSTHFVKSTALESTRMEANMLEEINDYYSEEIVGRLDGSAIPITHRYASTPNAIPLPFTFMIDAGKRISDSESGMQVKIYSDYPWNPECGPQDGFERRAIRALGLECRTEGDAGEDADTRMATKGNVDGRSYYEFSDTSGQPELRYARAQIMYASCIQCHNNDPDSPKRDWVVGEVAGVLSITRPLQRDVSLARSSLRSAFNLIAGVACVLIGMSVIALRSVRKRTNVSPGAIHGHP